MNKIDSDFSNLIETLNRKSLDEIKENIKKKHLELSEKTKKSLENYFSKFAYWGKLDEENNEFEHIYEKAKALKERISDYNFLYQNLGDYRSKKLLYAILNHYYQYDFQTMEEALEKNFYHYFDLDIIAECNDEVLVDVGAYTGDTILDFIKIYGSNSYKKIYAYEITEEALGYLKENTKNNPNINIINKAVLNEPGKAFIEYNEESISANTIGHSGKEITATTLDEDIKEKITIIKMDIEGSEQKALIGAKNHIKNDTPTLLISVYHNLKDLYQIPKLINEIKPGYKFYLRCYGNCVFPTEIVLIAQYHKEEISL